MHNLRRFPLPLVRRTSIRLQAVPRGRTGPSLRAACAAAVPLAIIPHGSRAARRYKNGCARVRSRPLPDGMVAGAARGGASAPDGARLERPACPVQGRAGAGAGSHGSAARCRSGRGRGRPGAYAPPPFGPSGCAGRASRRRGAGAAWRGHVERSPSRRGENADPAAPRWRQGTPIGRHKYPLFCRRSVGIPHGAQPVACRACRRGRCVRRRRPGRGGGGRPGGTPAARRTPSPRPRAKSTRSRPGLTLRPRAARSRWGPAFTATPS